MRAAWDDALDDAQRDRRAVAVPGQPDREWKRAALLGRVSPPPVAVPDGPRGLTGIDIARHLGPRSACELVQNETNIKIMLYQLQIINYLILI